MKKVVCSKPEPRVSLLDLAKNGCCMNVGSRDLIHEQVLGFVQLRAHSPSGRHTVCLTAAGAEILLETPATADAIAAHYCSGGFIGSSARPIVEALVSRGLIFEAKERASSRPLLFLNLRPKGPPFRR